LSSEKLVWWKCTKGDEKWNKFQEGKMLFTTIAFERLIGMVQERAIEFGLYLRGKAKGRAVVIGASAGLRPSMGIARLKTSYLTHFDVEE
jgi:hypothetical protein